MCFCNNAYSSQYARDIGAMLVQCFITVCDDKPIKRDTICNAKIIINIIRNTNLLLRISEQTHFYLATSRTMFINASIIRFVNLNPAS